MPRAARKPTRPKTPSERTAAWSRRKKSAGWVKISFMIPASVHAMVADRCRATGDCKPGVIGRMALDKFLGVPS